MRWLLDLLKAGQNVHYFILLNFWNFLRFSVWLFAAWAFSSYSVTPMHFLEVGIISLFIQTFFLVLGLTVVVAEDAELFRLKIWKVSRWSYLAVDVSRLREKLAPFCLLGSWNVCLEEKLSVNQELAVVIDNCNRSNIYRVCRLLLCAHQERRNVDWFTPERLQISWVLATFASVHAEAVNCRNPTSRQLLIDSSDIGKVFKALADLGLGGSTVAWVPASLHGEQDASIGRVQIIVVEVLHHKQSAPVVLMRRVHDVVVHMQGAIIQRSGKQIRAQVILVLRHFLAESAQELMVSHLASCLQLRRVLVSHWFVYANRHTLAVKLIESSLTHKDKVIVGDRFVRVQYDIGRQKLGRRFCALVVNVLHVRFGLGKSSVVECFEKVLFCQLAIHRDLIVFVAHFIELFVSKLAFAIWTD